MLSYLLENPRRIKWKTLQIISETSLNGELTLSMCVRGNEKDKTVVEKFFDLMEKNIKMIAEEKTQTIFC